MNNTQITAGTTILLERDYDDTTWQVAGIFSANDSNHYSDGQVDRRSYELTQEDVDFLNPLWNRASVGVSFDENNKATLFEF